MCVEFEGKIEPGSFENFEKVEGFSPNDIWYEELKRSRLFPISSQLMLRTKVQTGVTEMVSQKNTIPH